MHHRYNCTRRFAEKTGLWSDPHGKAPLPSLGLQDFAERLVIFAKRSRPELSPAAAQIGLGERQFAQASTSGQIRSQRPVSSSSRSSSRPLKSNLETIPTT